MKFPGVAQHIIRTQDPIDYGMHIDIAKAMSDKLGVELYVLEDKISDGVGSTDEPWIDAMIDVSEQFKDVVIELYTWDHSSNMCLMFRDGLFTTKVFDPQIISR